MAMIRDPDINKGGISVWITLTKYLANACAAAAIGAEKPRIAEVHPDKKPTWFPRDNRKK
jgi:hypothetical protein